ncbi:MAG: polysaccharide deacetylase family protein [Rhodospirillales bacterium]|nr:polysaccharide deacetylase family protein [Rhodospirillales bacterium]
MKKLALLLLLLGCYVPQAIAAESAVILMYHRFGESQFPSTNIRLEQLDAHIQELKSGPYTVLPVVEIVSKIKSGTPLPDRTVGITVDDGFKSIYQEAWPRFKRANLPFTVFVSTDPFDENRASHLTWDEVREMKAAGVDFGAHTASHLHMTAAAPAKNEAEIKKSNTRLANELGRTPTLFAYPFGEAGTEVIKTARIGGYAFSFGQHSGVIHPKSDFNYLPRFAMNEKFGSPNRFKLVINTLPFPVTDFVPKDTKIGPVNPPNVGFTAAPGLINLSSLTCYVSGEGRVPVTLLGTNRIEIRARKPFSKGRTRLNCTLLGAPDRWHWLGTLFVRPKT